MLCYIGYTLRIQAICYILYTIYDILCRIYCKDIGCTIYYIRYSIFDIPLAINYNLYNIDNSLCCILYTVQYYRLYIYIYIYNVRHSFTFFLSLSLYIYILYIYIYIYIYKYIFIYTYMLAPPCKIHLLN